MDIWWGDRVLRIWRSRSGNACAVPIPASAMAARNLSSLRRKTDGLAGDGDCRTPAPLLLRVKTLAPSGETIHCTVRSASRYAVRTMTRHPDPLPTRPATGQADQQEPRDLADSSPVSVFYAARCG